VTDLSAFARLVGLENGLSVVSVHRPDGTIHSSVVNAGVLPHPVTNLDVVGFVAVGGASKVAYMRSWPTVTIVVRVRWEWVAVEGEPTLIGPEDQDPSLPERERVQLLRSIFSAAGGAHDDWEAYDRTMAEEGRTAVLVSPERIYTNAGNS
jgi:hypothetical protein